MWTVKTLCLFLIFFKFNLAFAVTPEFRNLDDFEHHPIAAWSFDRPRVGTKLNQPWRLYKELLLREQQNGVLSENQSKIYLHSQVTNRSALIIAGLYDTPRFMSGLAKTLYAQGMNVIVLRLSGHGTGRVVELLDVRYQSWLHDLELGLKFALLLGEKVTVMGHSTGGTLAAISGCDFQSEVDNVVLLAPALDLPMKTTVVVDFSAKINLNSDRVCPEPSQGGVGCTFMNLLNSVFTSQLIEKLPVVPAAGVQVNLLTKYAQARCGSTYQLLKKPVFLVSTAADDVVNHDYNVEVSTKNNWQRLLFAKGAGVSHVNLPKSADDEFAKSPLSHNPHIDSLRGRIVDFIFSTDELQSAPPTR